MVIIVVVIIEIELSIDRMLELGENKIYFFLNYFFLY